MKEKGLKEYWMIDPSEHTVMTFQLKNGQYGRRGMYVKDDHIKCVAVNSLTVELGEIFKA